MLKRQIQIGLVKASKKKVDELNDTEDGIDRIAMYGAAASNLLIQSAKVVAIYMAADTIRKIAINRLSK